MVILRIHVDRRVFVSFPPRIQSHSRAYYHQQDRVQLARPHLCPIANGHVARYVRDGRDLFLDARHWASGRDIH